LVLSQVWRALPQNGGKSGCFYIETIPEAVGVSKQLYYINSIHCQVLSHKGIAFFDLLQVLLIYE
jgi:hypothetical protein